jgi:hypothetical protein
MCMWMSTKQLCITSAKRIHAYIYTHTCIHVVIFVIIWILVNLNICILWWWWWRRGGGGRMLRQVCWSSSNRTVYITVQNNLRVFRSSILSREHNWSVRSQWSRALRHEPSSIARTLGSWAQIPLKAWMCVCVRLFCVCVVLCVGSVLATGWSPVQEVLPTVYRLANWRSGQGPQGL